MKKKEEEMKPCPFCGNIDKVIFEYIDFIGAGRISCTKCNMNIYSYRSKSKINAKNNLLKKWNNRAVI